MKTITIPTNHNPYTVVINNKEYTYKGGETISVPDEVAEAIEDALELEPKPKRYLSKYAKIVAGILDEIDTKELEGITAIYPHAFYDIKGIKSVTIPNSVTSVGGFAFFSCSNLVSIRFESKSNLKTIKESAFKWCSELKSVYLPATPPTLEDVSAFANIHASCTFYCPSQASLDSYKAAPNWSTLTGTYAFVVEE